MNDVVETKEATLVCSMNITGLPPEMKDYARKRMIDIMKEQIHPHPSKDDYIKRYGKYDGLCHAIDLSRWQREIDEMTLIPSFTEKDGRLEATIKYTYLVDVCACTLKYT